MGLEIYLMCWGTRWSVAVSLCCTPWWSEHAQPRPASPAPLAASTPDRTSWKKKIGAQLVKPFIYRNCQYYECCWGVSKLYSGTFVKIAKLAWFGQQLHGVSVRPLYSFYLVTLSMAKIIRAVAEELNTNMEHRWNDTNRRKRKDRKWNLPQCALCRPLILNGLGCRLRGERPAANSWAMAWQ